MSIYTLEFYTFQNSVTQKLPSLSQFNRSKASLLPPIFLRGNLREWKEEGILCHSEVQSWNKDNHPDPLASCL